MAHFCKQAEFEQMPDGRHWRLTDWFAFWTSATGSIAVPKGFVTDMASVPKLFWNILPPFGRYTDAAVLHDYLYRTQVYPRATCDRLLLQAMKASRVKWWQRTIIYLNVRWFGGIAWRDDSRRIPVKDFCAEKYGGKHHLHS
jgi:hypothetical protein